MHELVKYIGDILNIKTDSVYTIQDMTEELSKVKDIVAYRSYIKNNLDKIDYKTGFQKFILLTQQYLQLEYVAINPNTKEEACHLSSVAYNIITDGKYNGLVSYYGTSEEKRFLKTIGGAKEIQRLLDEEVLEQTIIEKIIYRDNKLPHDLLPERLSKMIGSTTKGMA